MRRPGVERRTVVTIERDKAAAQLTTLPDAKADGRVRFLEITGKAGIGAYVGAPIRFSDGTLYGTLCLLSHSPEPSLAERDAQFVRVLARLVAEQIERQRRLLRRARERARAHERRIIGREL